MVSFPEIILGWTFTRVWLCILGTTVGELVRGANEATKVFEVLHEPEHGTEGERDATELLRSASRSSCPVPMGPSRGPVSFTRI